MDTFARELVLAACFSLLVTATVHAATIGAEAGIGLGLTTVRPLESQNAPGGLVHLGVHARLSERLHLGLEFAQSASVEFLSTNLESAKPGRRSLQTMVVAAELGPHYYDPGTFASLGVGFGRSKLNDATRKIQGVDAWLVPERRLEALGLTAAVGYRVPRGPKHFGHSLALRAQLLPHSGQIAASAYAVTFGLAY